MSVCMLIFSSFSTGVARNVLVAFLCIWAFVSGGCICPSMGLASVEIYSLRLRTYGQANTTFVYQVFAFGAAV